MPLVQRDAIIRAMRRVNAKASREPKARSVKAGSRRIGAAKTVRHSTSKPTGRRFSKAKDRAERKKIADTFDRAAFDADGGRNVQRLGHTLLKTGALEVEAEHRNRFVKAAEFQALTAIANAYNRKLMLNAKDRDDAR